MSLDGDRVLDSAEKPHAPQTMSREFRVVGSKEVEPRNLLVAFQ